MEHPNGNGNGWERPDAPLGTLIYRAGLLSKEKLEDALVEGQKSGRRLGEILLQKGWIDEKDLARLLAGQRRLSFVSLRGRGYDHEVARMLPERLARFHNALPVEASDDEMLVAIADPTDDEAVAELRSELGRDFELVVATATEIRAALDDVYKQTDGAPVPPVVTAPLGGDLGLRLAAPAATPETPPVATDVPVLEPQTEAEPAPVAVAETPAIAMHVPAPEPVEAEPAPVPLAETAPEASPLLLAPPTLPTDAVEPAPADAIAPLRPDATAQVEPAGAGMSADTALAPSPTAEAVAPATPVEPEYEPAPRVAAVPLAQPEPGPPVADPAPGVPPLVGADPSPPDTGVTISDPSRPYEPPPSGTDPPAVPADVFAPVISFPASEPTIERIPEAHVSVAFHAPASEPEPEPEREPQAAASPEFAAAPAATTSEPARPVEMPFRLVLNLEGEDDVEVGVFETESDAEAAARALIEKIETRDDWPRVESRFIRPDRIRSLDIRERPRHTGSASRARWAESGDSRPGA